MRSCWNLVGCWILTSSFEIWNGVIMTSSHDLLWFFLFVAPLSHKLLSGHGIIQTICLNRLGLMPREFQIQLRNLETFLWFFYIFWPLIFFFYAILGKLLWIHNKFQNQLRNFKTFWRNSYAFVQKCNHVSFVLRPAWFVLVFYPFWLSFPFGSVFLLHAPPSAALLLCLFFAFVFFFK